MFYLNNLKLLVAHPQFVCFSLWVRPESALHARVFAVIMKTRILFYLETKIHQGNVYIVGDAREAYLDISY